jgi:NADPH:quinone reductase-like Zn-dependent oxidoreductase
MVQSGESGWAMKAVVYEKYGSPDVLELREIAKPSVADDEVLVKVHAASIQQTDINFRTGTLFLARVLAGLFKPKNQILGCDYSGAVEATGMNVDEYDIIFDAVRKNTFANCKNALAQKGIYVTTEFGPTIMLQMKMNSNPNGKRMVGMLLNVDPLDCCSH